MFRRFLKRRVGKIDNERLTLFTLADGERPIETVIGWMPLAFANAFGMQDGEAFNAIPPDGAMGLSHDDWFDTEESDKRAAVFGLGLVTMALVLVLVSDRRLIWLPLDTEAVAKSSAYPTFSATALGQRWIRLSDIEFAEPRGIADVITDLPGGYASNHLLRLQVSPAVEISGEPYPIWAPLMIPGWNAEGDELQVWASQGMENLTDLLALALGSAGVAFSPGEYENDLRQGYRNWKPLHDRS